MNSEPRVLEIMSKNNFEKLSKYLFDNFDFRNLGILITMHIKGRIQRRQINKMVVYCRFLAGDSPLTHQQTIVQYLHY